MKKFIIKKHGIKILEVDQSEIQTFTFDDPQDTDIFLAPVREALEFLKISEFALSVTIVEGISIINKAAYDQ